MDEEKETEGMQLAFKKVFSIIARARKEDTVTKRTASELRRALEHLAGFDNRLLQVVQQEREKHTRSAAAPVEETKVVQSATPPAVPQKPAVTKPLELSKTHQEILGVLRKAKEKLSSAEIMNRTNLSLEEVTAALRYLRSGGLVSATVKEDGVFYRAT